MTPIRSMALACGCGITVLLAAGPASAETVCGTIAEFNAAMVAGDTYTADVTLVYDVGGVNPADFAETKGSLGQMRNTACNGGEQDATIKVYGNSEPLNEAHPPGTLKLEYGNACCGGECNEGWADPNASVPIFLDGSEQCNVTMWVNPASIGYTLLCGGTSYDAIGDNTYSNQVDHIAVLEYFLADGGTTWELPNATATNDEVCWVTIPTDTMSLTVPVAEDVTADPSAPTTVFADVGDLAVEAAAQAGYLKFVVPEIAGKVTETTLFMHTRTESFAEGDGGEVFVVTDNDWSEASLTWNTRPLPSGAALGRVGPAAADIWVSLDLGAGTVTEAGTYSFAVVSPATDGNGTHFFSKEGLASAAPYLLVKYDVVDADGDGTPDGPDCDDADPVVNPDADEACNGVDDDCDGEVDEGCSGAEGGDSGSGGGGGSDADDGGGSDGGSAGDGGIGSGGSFGLERGGGADGCACAVRPGNDGGWAAYLAFLVLPITRRRPGRRPGR